MGLTRVAQPGHTGYALNVDHEQRVDRVVLVVHDGLGVGVTEPAAVGGEVLEAHGLPHGYLHRRAASAVAPLLHRVSERIPTVEITEHGHRHIRLGSGQGERDLHCVTAAGVGASEHGALLWEIKNTD